MTKRRSFTEEFKREAVRLANERGNVTAAARDLGISAPVLDRWTKQLKQTPSNAFPGNGNPRNKELAAIQKEIRRHKEENEILRKGSRVRYCLPAVRYQFIKEHKEQYSLVALCRAMAVSRGGFHAWLARHKSAPEVANEQLPAQINTVHK